MKKNYLEPEVELIELETLGFLAASAGISEDGEVTPGEGDPGSEGWGSDY